MIKRILLLGVALLSLLHLSAQNTVGTGKKADGGSGKYVESIYWLSFGRKGTELQDGDTARFRTPQGLTYTIIFSKVSADAPTAALTTSYPGNNFPTAYSFLGTDTSDAIGLYAYNKTLEFDLTLTVSDDLGDTTNYGNIVIAGTETLNGSVSSGVKTESYSLEVQENADSTGIHIPSLNVIETYIKDNNFSNLALQVDVHKREVLKAKNGNVDTLKYEKLTVTNPQVGDSKGDALLAATDVHKIRATVKSTSGGQHFAIGVLDLGDRGDLPKSFEYFPNESEVSDPAAPAVHINTPIIVTPKDAEAPKMLADGTHYFVGSNGKTHFTDLNGNALGHMATLMKPMLRIGTLIDFEEVPRYGANANGDDITNENDEDGVNVILMGCSGVVGIYNNKNAKAYLHYWIDLNENGHFEENEHGKTQVPANYYNEETINGKVVRTDKKFYFDMQNIWAQTPIENHNYYARFRVSTQEEQAYYGLVDQGEVEDYVIQFVRPTVFVNNNISCSGADEGGKATVIHLPKTGWKVVLKKDGVQIREESSFNGLSNPTSLVLDNLTKGSYEIVMNNNDPNGCEFTDTFEITDPTVSECDENTYKQSCTNPVRVNYPEVSPSGVIVSITGQELYNENGTPNSNGECDIDISGTYRQLANTNDYILYTFSEPIKSADVWLLSMGHTESGGWYPEDIAVLEAGGNATTTQVNFASADCQANAFIMGNQVTVPASQNKANLTNFKVTVSSDTPFTTLKVINPNDRINSSAEQKGYGFFPELCLNSLDNDADGDGIFNNEDLDDDNDGILDYEETNKICETKTLWIQRPQVQTATGVTNKEKAIDNNEDSYCSIYLGSSELVLKFANELPAGTTIKFRGFAGYRNINVQEAPENGTGFSSKQEVIFVGSGIVDGSSYQLRNNTKYLKITRAGGSRLRAYLADVKAIEEATICHIENIDTDGDGIPNHLDLDSDGDDCSDALEANVDLQWTDLVTDNSIDISLAGTNGVNTKGVPYGKEATNKGTSQQSEQQAEACDPCDITKNTSLTDTDADGVADNCDLDDDNDGILDIQEQQDCDNQSTTGIWKNNNGDEVTSFALRNAIVNAEIGNGVKVKVTLTRIKNKYKFETQTGGFQAPAPDYNYITGKAPLKKNYTNGEEFKIEFFNEQGQPIYVADPYIYINQLGQNGSSAKLTLLGGLTWSKVVGINNFNVTDTTVVGTELGVNGSPRANGILKVKGLVHVIRVATELIVGNPADYTNYDSVWMLFSACPPADTDQDNIPDYLDLDSDNDGCSDALEGTKNLNVFVDAQGNLADGNNGQVTQNLGNTVDDNGVPTLADGGQGIGQSVNAEKNDCKDTDGDSVPDWKDLDNDNDGILDADEGCSTKPQSSFILDSEESDEGVTGIGKLVYKNAEGYKVVLSATGTYGGTDSSPWGYSGADGTVVVDKNLGHINFEIFGGENLDQPKLKVEAFNPQGQAIDIISIALGGIMDMDNSDAQDAVAANVQGKWSNLTKVVNGTSNTLGCAQIDIVNGGATPVSGVTQAELDAFSFTNFIIQGAKSEVIFNNHDNTVQGPYNATFTPDVPVSSFYLIVDDIKDIRNVFTQFEAETIEVAVQDCEKDTDGDGILDYLDLDSDNDGCSDALEGAKDLNAFVEVQGGLVDGNNGQVTQNLGNTVDDNGVPTLADGGQGIGQSVDANKNDCQDIDVDGVPDWKDLDNDNDGILDTNEGCSTKPQSSFILDSEESDEGATGIGKLVYKNAEGYKVILSASGTDGTILDTYQSSNPDDPRRYDGSDGTIITNTATGHINFEIFSNDAGDQPKLKVEAFNPQGEPIDIISIAFGGIIDMDNSTAQDAVAADVEGKWSNLTLNGNTLGCAQIDVSSGGAIPVSGVTQAELNGFTFANLINQGAKSEVIFNNHDNTVEGPYNAIFTPDVPVHSFNLIVDDINGVRNVFTQFEATSIEVASKDCVKDTDGDGILDYLDLDSDNDGCSDALEGDKNLNTFADAQGGLVDGNNGQVTKNLGNTVDDNGVPTLADGGQAIGQSVNANKNDCKDIDGDGVPDWKDLDNDNDGILDADEGACISSALLDWGDYHNNTSTSDYVGGDNLLSNMDNVQTTDLNVTYSRTVFGNVSNVLSKVNSWKSGYKPHITFIEKVTSNVDNNYTEHTFNFSHPVKDLKFKILDVDERDKVTLLIVDKNGLSYELTSSDYSLGGGQVFNSPNTFIAQGPNNTHVSINIPVSVRRITFVYKAKSSSTYNMAIGITKMEFNFEECMYQNIDSDNDGTPNRLDIDSDNDGCPDALEGLGSLSLSDLHTAPENLIDAENSSVTRNLGIDVDNNGVPNSANEGQMPGTAYNAEQQTSACKDKDGDAVSNLQDLDGDNDGILDTEENKICASDKTPVPAAPTARIWEQSGYHCFAYGVQGSHDGNGFQKSGFEKYLLEERIPYKHLDDGDTLDFKVLPGETIAQNDNEVYFGGGKITYKGTGSLAEPVQFGITTDVYDIISGASGCTAFIEINQEIETADDKYSVNIHFNTPVKAFSFDVIDILDPSSSGSYKNSQVNILIDGELQMYFKGKTTHGSVGSYELFDVNGISQGTIQAGHRTETTLGFVSDARFNQVTFELVLKETVSTYWDYIGIDNFVYSYDCDTDGDGIPNYLDLDSDNDGCPDALEGDANFTTENLVESQSLNDGNGGLVTQNLGNTVDDNGVPNIVNGGQTVGSSEDANINVCLVQAENDINQTPQGKAVKGNILTNDRGEDFEITKITIEGVDYPMTSGTSGEITIDGKGTITINEDGSYIFAPEADFTGKVPSITYTIEKPNGYSDTANLDIKVIPVLNGSENNPPIAENDTYTAEGTEPVTVKLLSNDSDPDGDELTVTEASGLDSNGNPVQLTETDQDVYVEDPNNPNQYIKAGTAKLVDGELIFTPKDGFSGDVPFDYTISDGNGGTDTATAIITVVPSNNINDTHANDDANTGEKGANQTGNVTDNDSDPENNPIKVTQIDTDGDGVPDTDVTETDQTIDIKQADAEGNLQVVGQLTIKSDGTYDWQPNADFVGTVDIAYELSDVPASGTATAKDKATLHLTSLDKVEAQNDINQTPQGKAVKGNVLTNDKGDNIKVTQITIDGVDYPVNSGTTGDINIDGVGIIKINEDGSYIFTPDADFTGKVPSITYTIENADGSTDKANLDIKVIPMLNGSENNPPIAENDTYTAEGTEPVTVKLLSNDSDPDGDELTVTDASGLDSNGNPVQLAETDQDVYVEDPNNPNQYIKAGTAKLVDGELIFTPKDGFSGDVPFDYTISDGNGGTDTATATITVVPSNNINDTHANDDANVGEKGANQTGNVTDNDSDPEGNPIKVSQIDTDGDGVPDTDVTEANQTIDIEQADAEGNLQVVGQLTIKSDGTYDWQPNADFVGTVDIAYELSDVPTGGTAIAKDKATLHLTSLDKVEAQNDINQTPQGKAVKGNVLTNDKGDNIKVTQITIDGVDYPVNSGTTGDINIDGKGTIKINEDGSYIFTPDADFTGKVPSITYTIENADGSTDKANLDIKVIPMLNGSENNPPIAENDTYTAEGTEPVTVKLLSNDSDPDGDDLSVTKVTGLDNNGNLVQLGNTDQDVYVEDPNNPNQYIKAGTAKLVNGELIFTPEDEFSGDVPFDYTISDGNGGTDTATATITVVSSNNINDTHANDDANTGEKGANQTGNVTNNDSDPENNPIKVTQIDTDGDGVPDTDVTETDQTIDIKQADAEGNLQVVGQLTIKSDGTYDWQPNADFVGTVDIAYELSDVPTGGTVTAKDKATLHLTSLDEPIKTKDDFVQTPKGVDVQGNILTNDNGVDLQFTKATIVIGGQTYTINPGEETTLPGYGKITINSDGTYTFSPNDDFEGKLPPLTYTATDKYGQESSSELYIRVIPEIKTEKDDNDVPVANHDVYRTAQGETVSFNIMSNDHDSDRNRELAVTQIKFPNQDGSGFETIAIPAGGSSGVQALYKNGKKVGDITVNSDGSVNFTPVADFTGEVPDIEYTIDDAHNGTDTANIKIDILPTNKNLVIANDDYGVARNSADVIRLDLLHNDLDPEGTTKTITSLEFYNQNGDLETFDMPQNGFSGKTIYNAQGQMIGTLGIDALGHLTFKGMPDFRGTLAVPYTLKDTDGNTDKATIYLTQLRTGDTPLPIVLYSFEVLKQDRHTVDLEWVSLTEINNDYYSIYKSEDAVNWVLLEQVSGAGNSLQKRTYQITDYKPYASVTYYKLVQTDFDGQTEDLGIRSVRMTEKAKANSIKAYPNPTSDRITIQGVDAGIEEVKIFNNWGVELSAHITKQVVSLNSWRFDLSELPSGVYFIRIDETVLKVIKE